MEARDGGVVLVVDDDAEVRRLIAEALEPFRADVRLAATGEEALELMAGCRVLLLLLDLDLPGIDGLAVLEKLEREGADIPVVVLADEAGSGAVEAKAHGACDVLRKPFRSRDVRSLARRHLIGRDPGERSS